MKENKPYYHTLFLRVEFDRQYTGGDYSRVGEFVLIPVVLEDALGMPKAFTKVTGLSAVHIVHYSSSELYDGNGELVEDGYRAFDAEAL